MLLNCLHSTIRGGNWDSDVGGEIRHSTNNLIILK